MAHRRSARLGDSRIPDGPSPLNHVTVTKRVKKLEDAGGGPPQFFTPAYPMMVTVNGSSIVIDGIREIHVFTSAKYPRMELWRDNILVADIHRIDTIDYRTEYV